MTEEEKTLLMLKGLVAGLPPEQAVKINQCAEQIRTLITANGDEGYMAIAITAAELQIEATKKGF